MARERDKSEAWLNFTEVGENEARVGERAQNKAARIDGRSVRAFAESRETQPIAEFGRMGAHWRESEIKGRLVRNVRKSEKMRPEWGERPQNQAAWINGRSVRIFATPGETQPTVGFDCRAHSWRESEIMGRRA